MSRLPPLHLQLATILLVVAITISATHGKGQFSPEEAEALSKFRPTVTKFLPPGNDFMNSDAYLISWLRESNLDLGRAKELLLNALKWRKDTQIESSVNEDFSDFDKKYPFNIEGVDKDGRPIQIAPAGAWRPRQAVLAGQLEKYNRFMIRTMLEIPFQKIQEQAAEGKNVSSYIMIMDLHGINAREHLCLQCLQVYASLVTAAERYYPRLAYKTFFINTPRVFDTVLTVIRPLMTDYTKSNLNVLDHDRTKWQSQLLQFIDAEQLPPRYGGTKQFKQNDYYSKSYEETRADKKK